MPAKIFDPGWLQAVAKLLGVRAGGRPEEEPVAPADVSPDVLVIVDATDLLTAATPRKVTLSGTQPVLSVVQPGSADGDLFTTDPADTVNQTQDITQVAGGAGVFSAAGFKVAARALLPTRLDLVYITLRPSVDCQIGVALEGFTAAFAGKNLVNADTSGRSGVVDAASTGGTKRAAVSAAAEANVRYWVPFHAANTLFTWAPPQPEFRLSPGAIPNGLRVMCVSDVANLAIRVQWGVVWRQVPTP